MRIFDGGPAFPRAVSEDRTDGDQPDGNATISDQTGMTLRDWLTGKALEGIMAAEASGDGTGAFTLRKDRPVFNARPEHYAEAAVMLADATLAALAKPRPAAPQIAQADADEE